MNKNCLEVFVSAAAQAKELPDLVLVIAQVRVTLFIALIVKPIHETPAAELGGERLRGEARPADERAAAVGDGDAEEALRGREALLAEC